MRKIILITALLITSFNTDCFALKKELKKGVIITSKDTINCFFNQVINYPNRKNLKYKLSLEDEEFKKISIKEIKQLHTEQDKYYRITTNYIPGKGAISYLMKLLTKGEITLYEYAYDISSQHGGGQNYTYYLIIDNKISKFKKRKAEKILPELFTDNQDLLDKLKQMKRKDFFQLETIVELIESYNQSKL